MHGRRIFSPELPHGNSRVYKDPDIHDTTVILHYIKSQGKGENRYMIAEVTNGIYGIAQAGRISNNVLVQHLAPYGYHPSRKTPELWTHGSLPVKLTLVVNDFYVKYSVK